MLEQRPGLHARLAVPSEVGIVDEVAGHQVDGALDALERTPDPARQGLKEGRLANPDVSLKQDVPARERGGEQQANRPLLADHDSVGTCFEPERPLAPRFNLDHRFTRRFSDGIRPGAVADSFPDNATPPRWEWAREP